MVASDLAQEVDWLLGASFVWRSGYSRMADFQRYFKAMEERLQRLTSLPQFKDDEKRERVQQYWSLWLECWKEQPEAVKYWPCGWLLMEWRIAEFAPSFPRKVKVSEKRIQVMFDELDIAY